MNEREQITGKRFKSPVVIAWFLCAAAFLAALITFVLLLIQRGQSENPLQLAGDALWPLLPISFAITGALIISQKPGNVIGWLLMAPVILSIFSTPFQFFINTSTPPPSNPGFLFLFTIWFSGWDWLVLIFPLLLIALLFPTGRPPSPRWRWMLILAAGLCSYFLFISTFSKVLQSPDANWSVPNPIGFLGESAVETLLVPWPAGLMIFTILCAASLFVRYRRATSTQRLQIKWLLFAGCVFVLIYVPGIWLNSLTSGNYSFAANLFNLLFGLAILTFPTSIAFAILQYHLWDIDVLIRRTLIYTVLTVILALFYFGSVLALQQIFRLLTGNTSPIALVISTLAIAALFAPLRKRLQDFIDRRFYRQKYDAARTLETFSAAARDEVELAKLTNHLLSAAGEAMQPLSISLWLKPAADGKPHPLDRMRKG